MLAVATPSQATKQECSFFRVSNTCSYADVASVLTSLAHVYAWDVLISLVKTRL